MVKDVDYELFKSQKLTGGILRLGFVLRLKRLRKRLPRWHALGVPFPDDQIRAVRRVYTQATMEVGITFLKEKASTYHV